MQNKIALCFFIGLCCCNAAPIPQAQITVLKGGLSGAQVYKLSIDSKAYVIKTNDPFECAQQEYATQYHLAPKIIGKDDTYVFMEYQKSDDFWSLPSEQKIFILSQFLKKLHGIPITKTMKESAYSTRLMRASSYEQFLEIKGRLPDAIRQYLETLFRETQDLALKAYKFSHNDLNGGNLIFKAKTQTLQAIDFGMGGLNDPLYDVADAAVCNLFHPLEHLKLLESYLGRKPTKKELAHFQKLKKLNKVFSVSFLLNAAFKKGIPPQETLPQKSSIPFYMMNKLETGLELYNFALAILDAR